MLHRSVRIRTPFALASVAGLALSLLGGAAASAGTAQPQAAAVRWSRVTPAGTGIIDDIGLARGRGGILHVLWTGGTTTVWKVYVSADATKVDVLALVTLRGNSRGTAYWHAQVPLPR